MDGKEISLKSDKTEEKTVEQLEATEGAAIRQERAGRRRKTLYVINFVGFAPFWSRVENEAGRDEKKKRIATKAAGYRKRNISFWNSYLDGDNKQVDTIENRKITTQSQEMGGNEGRAEQFLSLDSPIAKGVKTRIITPKRKFHTSSNGVTESPAKKQRTSENFKQKLRFWSNIEILEKSENLNRTSYSNSKYTSQSEAEHLSHELLVSPSLSLGGGKDRQFSWTK